MDSNIEERAQSEYSRFNKRWKGLSDTIFSLAGSILGPEILATINADKPDNKDKYEIALPNGYDERNDLLVEILRHAKRIRNAYRGADPVEAHFKAKIFLSLNYLWLFAGERIRYFNDGFFMREENNLEPSIPYPPQYVINQLLARTSRDVSTFQKLYTQRQTPAWREHLEKADYLANLALKPAVDKRLVGEAQIITYFHKEMSIRVIPYANVALIGIPYESLGNPVDLMAIPHEVGHHVYVNGTYKLSEFGRPKYISQLLDVKAAEYPFWIRQWMEEIFADVYGAIIAGPVMALSAQYMISEKSPKGRVTDDGEHPVDIVRPLVYQYILRTLNGMALVDEKEDEKKKENDGESTEKVVDVAEQVIRALELRWETSNFGIRKRFRPKPESLGFNEDDHGRYIPEEEAAEWLRKLFSESDEILALRDLLDDSSAESAIEEALFPLGNWGRLQALPDGGEPEPEVMFANFTASFNRQFEESEEGLEGASLEQVSKLKLEDMEVDELYSTLLIYNLRQPNKTESDIMNRIQVPINVWIHIYEGDAWGEHGPKTYPVIDD